MVWSLVTSITLTMSGGAPPLKLAAAEYGAFKIGGVVGGTKDEIDDCGAARGFDARGYFGRRDDIRLVDFGGLPRTAPAQRIFLDVVQDFASDRSVIAKLTNRLLPSPVAANA